MAEAPVEAAEAPVEAAEPSQRVLGAVLGRQRPLTSRDSLLLSMEVFVLLWLLFQSGIHRVSKQLLLGIP